MELLEGLRRSDSKNFQAFQALEQEHPEWRSMYPDVLVDDSRIESVRGWARDLVHHPSVRYPLEALVNQAIFQSKGAWSSGFFRLPGSYGTEHRLLLGHTYVSPLPVVEAQTRLARGEVFSRRAGEYFSAWDSRNSSWIDEVSVLAGETEQLAVRLEFAGSPRDDAPNSRVYQRLYRQLIDNLFTAWSMHFELLSVAYSALAHYTKLFTEEIQGGTDSLAASLIATTETPAQKATAGVRALREFAVRHDLTGILREADSWAHLSSLAGSRSAVEGLLELWEDVGDPWFNFSCVSDPLARSSRSWNQHPAYVWRMLDAERPLMLATRSSGSLGGKVSLDAYSPSTELLRAHRLACMVTPFIEGHSFYVEHWFHTAFWRGIRAVGRYLVESEVLGRGQDVFLLTASEVASLLDRVDVWRSNYFPARQAQTMDRRVLDKRRLALAAFSSWDAPIHVGDPRAVEADPSWRLLLGSVEERASSDGMLRGTAASPGQAEGRVFVLDPDGDPNEVPNGCVLVARTASPSLGPVLERVAALVTQSGGALSHAAVLAREFNVPGVVGVARAIEMLVQGALVVVDGSLGVVEVRGC